MSAGDDRGVRSKHYFIGNALQHNFHRCRSWSCFVNGLHRNRIVGSRGIHQRRGGRPTGPVGAGRWRALFMFAIMNVKS
jgi:hypothetical protein